MTVFLNARACVPSGFRRQAAACFTLLLIFGLLATGCSHRGSRDLSGSYQKPMTDALGLKTKQQLDADAVPSGSPYFHIDIFKIEAPLGTFSTSEAFWKTINEECVDPATADLLQRNGIRVGVASTSELSQFSKVMDDVIPADKLAVTTGEMKQTRITMKEHVQTENIFIFNKDNEAIGRTYPDECENTVNLSFQPAPRKPGQLRVTMCPVVRSLARQLKYTPLNNEYEINYYNPENMYDLKLKADVPLNSFLIVTPSDSAERSTSVGNAFFLKSGGADQMEQVLLVVPSQMRVGRAQSSAQ